MAANQAFSGFDQSLLQARQGPVSDSLWQHQPPGRASDYALWVVLCGQALGRARAMLPSMPINRGTRYVFGYSAKNLSENGD